MSNDVNNLWGGRFEENPDKFFFQFNQSLSFDMRLFPYDVELSQAYAKGLHQKGVFSEAELHEVLNGLNAIKDMVKKDPSLFQTALEEGIEDIHSFVEHHLVNLIGDAGYKLHSGRSRNDQVSTGLRMYCIEAIQQTVKFVKTLQRELLQCGRTHQTVVLPGYTHLQKAQPVYWAHYLLSFVEMFQRDVDRLGDCEKRVSTLTLGSGAIAGNSWGVDRELLKSELKFQSISQNSLDATSDRDFVLEFNFNLSTIMIHMSRLCEDLIIYSSNEFSLVEMSDQYATGSSLMPQKKNPDALELIRGKTGRVIGSLQGLMVMMKGLPSSYNKDMQEDKEALFNSIDTVNSCLQVMAGLVKTMKVKNENMEQSASCGYLNATELADYFCRKGIPFRKAHHLSGQVVRFAIEQGKELHELDLSDFQKFLPNADDDVFQALSLHATLQSKSSVGGTNAELVADQIKRMEGLIGFS